MSTWQTPKEDWNSKQQGVGDGDFNRIEGNTNWLNDNKEPIIGAKGTAFNSNFGGTGDAITVSKSDHTHLIYDFSPIGGMIMFGGDTAPDGWLICSGIQNKNGSVGSEYRDLWLVIGNKYGGTTESSFGIPNFDDRFPIGAGAQAGVGDDTGALSITLEEKNIPKHNHSYTGSEDHGSKSISDNGSDFWTVDRSYGSGWNSAGTIGYYGGISGITQAFPITPLSVGVNYIIKYA